MVLQGMDLGLPCLSESRPKGHQERSGLWQLLSGSGAATASIYHSVLAVLVWVMCDMQRGLRLSVYLCLSAPCWH